MDDGGLGRGPRGEARAGFAEKGGTFEMVQLWVNLPAKDKMSKPRYQAIAKEQIPSVKLGAESYARVIAGELNGTRGPAKTLLR